MGGNLTLGISTPGGTNNLVTGGYTKLLTINAAGSTPSPTLSLPTASSISVTNTLGNPGVTTLKGK